MSISERIRPGIEAAPWVCAEVGKLEVSYEAIKAQLAAEREASDKLEKALSQFIDAIPGDVIGKKSALDALAEVAAIRKGQA